MSVPRPLLCCPWHSHVLLTSCLFCFVLLKAFVLYYNPPFLISILKWSVDYSYPSIALILVPSGLTAPPIIPQALLESDFIEGNELPWPPLDVNDRRVPSLDCYSFIPVLVSPMVFIEDYLAIPRSKIILFIFQS